LDGVVDTYTNHKVQLKKGDCVYLFSDGYADQFGGENNKKFTRARFRELLLNIAQLPMEDQRSRLLSTHDQYRGSQEQVDDICVIDVRV
ncbi:MAG: PP2C family protein-serine/threonine phosphatase, partial [Flavobacteriales bacterium]